MRLLKEMSVLVVEDQFLIAMDLARMLRELGAAGVRTEFSASEALVLLTEHEPPNCAVLDFRLGAGTAEPVADALLTRRIPFIFVTGYDDSALIPKRLHDVPIARKPMSVADIAAAFNRALGSRQSD